MLNKKTLLSILLALVLVPSVQAREISMLTVEWAPHYGSELPEEGLTTAIVKAAFRASGHVSEVDFIPWTRALKEVEEGKADIVMGAYRNKEREQTYIFSDPIYFLQLGLIARPGGSGLPVMTPCANWRPTASAFRVVLPTVRNSMQPIISTSRSQASPT